MRCLLMKLIKFTFCIFASVVLHLAVELLIYSEETRNMNLFLYKDIHLAFRISVHLLPFRHFYVPLYRLMLKIVRISADFHGAEIMSLIF